MASRVQPSVPMGDETPDGAALQHSPWPKRALLSSALTKVEYFLESAGFDRGPWLVVALCGGIAAWFVLPGREWWIGWILLCLGLAAGSGALLRADGQFPYVRQSFGVTLLVLAAGCGLIWAKSALVGVPAIDQPMVRQITATVLDRVEQPAEKRVRLILATRNPDNGKPIKIRLNLAANLDRPALVEGAVIQVRARLIPPAAPMLPGGYDFARTAWFNGLSATGSALGEVTIVRAGQDGGLQKHLQRSLAAHVRSKLSGSSGAIASALASGDRGAIAEVDEQAMRDAGLTHLLSISGLHVSAVVAAAYVLALRLMGLIPWLALRVRLPLAAAGAGALAGIGYTLLTGAEVPTVRSCIGAVLVLVALTLGREPLSMRMIAVGAAVVLIVWPEALVGPSFQLSFAAVIAIVALHAATPVRRWLAVREEPWWAKGARHMGSLLLTGIVIELALMPIGLFHFHRAGVYGALANVVAIPLTTFISMPLIAIALAFDLVGLGAPFWWLAGKSIDLLLALAHVTAGLPGAVSLMPTMGRGAYGLFVAGGLWLALWKGRVRLLGLAPAILGIVLLTALRPPDILVSGDGRHVGITGTGPDLLVLRQGRSSFARDNLTELAGMNGETQLLADWPGARCNRDFCAATIRRGGRTWQLLIASSMDIVGERELAAACERVDIVIAPRYLPYSCRPRWIKADRRMLNRTGGLTIDLTEARVRTVAQGEGSHGWWNPPATYFRRASQPSASSGAKDKPAVQ